LLVNQAQQSETIASTIAEQAATILEINAVRH